MTGPPRANQGWSLAFRDSLGLTRPVTLAQVAQTFPTASVLAAGAYGLLLAVLASPFLRREIGGRLAMPSPSNQVHLAPLDAYRGLAALYVAVFHSWQWWKDAFAHVPRFIEEGDKAVPIFVALSGFLIYRALLPVKDADGFRRYLINRFLRIFPLYLASVLVMIAAGWYGGQALPLRAIVGDAFMLRSLGFPAFMNPPVWSLYVEVLFYLIVPAFVAVAGRRGLPWAAFVFIVFCMGDVANSRELSLWKYFAAGILASELHRHARDRLPEWGAVAIVAAGAALLALDVQLAPGWLDRAIQKVAPWLRPADLQSPYTVALAIATMLLLWGSACSRLTGAFFASAPWRVLAAASYSVFVWHSMIIVADAPVTFDGMGFLKPDGVPASGAPGWVIPAIYLPAYVLVGSLSFLTIERPFLLLRSRLWPKHVAARPVAAD